MDEHPEKKFFLTGSSNFELLRNLSESLPGRIGSLFKASEISGELGVESKTVAHWLSVLRASYIVEILPPYYENITKRLVKTPKLYFIDPGLACYLLDIESPSQLSRDMIRAQVQNPVFGVI